MTESMIERADEAEELAAAMSLRAATTRDELVSAWWAYADHFDGAARERLQDEYATQLRRFAPMQAAG